MDNPLLWGLGVVALLVALAIWLEIAEQNRWEQFSTTHKCIVVGKIRGTPNVGIIAGGNNNGGTVVTFSPDKTGWQCDDGITYWR